MDTPNLPRKRAGDTERQRIAQLLHDAHSDGQLTLSEFDERTKTLWATMYADELPALVEDLSPVAASAGTQVDRVARQPGGSGFSFSVMGASVKKGTWQIAPNHTSITVMGGNDIDLRHATLSARETVINAYAVMGGIDIIVPDDVRVIDDGIGIMGGFGIEDKGAVAPMDALPADAPIVRVRGAALMGGVGIIRVPRDG